jgi:hypothetical protein
MRDFLDPLMYAGAAEQAPSQPASPERAGQITVGMIHRELDRMMTAPDPCYFAMLELDPERVVRELGSMVDALFCRAVLFPLPPTPPMLGLLAVLNGETAVYGPAPATCSLEPHPGSPWHWADGTWWR